MKYLAIMLLGGVAILPACSSGTETEIVSRVIDGDTVELSDGQKVRLLGIDTPEVGECGYKEAKQFLASKIQGKRVALVTDHQDKDKYQRLLRYVEYKGQDMGLEQIKMGYAIAYYDSQTKNRAGKSIYPKHPRENKYHEEDEKKANLCLNK